MENLKNNFDVIVVGAGTGGSIAARFVAEKGLKVCLIDRKDKKDIGNKICGDAVGTEIFDFLNINHPKNEEFSCRIKGAKLYSPDQKKCIDLIDPKQAGYIINRLEFGQRLLNEAIDSGVDQFLDKTLALDLLYDKNIVNGVKVKLNNGDKVELHSKILIDASGFYSPLRKKVRSTLVENEISKDDSILCYREIVNFSPHDLKIKDPDYITIILNQDKAPGGYIWYFPKNESSVNIGLGTYMNNKGKVKSLYRHYVFNEFIKTSTFKIESSGGGVVPVRRPIWSCADDGIMFIGDAACQVNPLHGGGIDPSMRGGFYAAKAAADAFEKEDFSIRAIWNYNYNIMTSFGAEFASLDLLRMTLQVLSNEDLNFALRQDLLSGEEILEISSTGEFELPILSMVDKAFKGISRPNLLLDLNYLRIRMNEISKLYKNFPMNINQFDDWKNRAIQIYGKIKKMLIDTKKLNNHNK
ncbi:MAG: geranylgeranyl reductase family protein [Candidatus Lokiarchaeota archaeon]|nr:geranylgeranyl reductase family protein [Candidatus Lokiarchaeota archaeon]